MKALYRDLKNTDLLMYNLLKKEEKRQKSKLLLNAATSFTSKSILEVQGSLFDNIDAEGYIPDYISNQNLEDLADIEKQIDLYKKYKDDRCNKSCEYANIVEALAQKRLAKLFENEYTKDIFVNVQVPTGAIANFIVYNALLKKHDTILSLGVNDGGHTTHGDFEHQSSSDYNVINYHVSMEKNNIDYDEIKELLIKHKPQLLVAGATTFPLNIDWLRIRNLINKYSKETLFMADIAHTAGLVAGKVFNNPVGIADVTTLVAYKTFCGPRAGAIITTNEEIKKKIDETVFPKIMGSPLLLGICALAVSANIALTDEYKEMQANIVKNSRLLCEELKKLNIPVVYGTSDSHIVLIDCEKFGKKENITNILEDCDILVSGCRVPSVDGYHDGIRVGTTCITQFDISEENVKLIAKIIADILNQAKNNNVDYENNKAKVAKIVQEVFGDEYF